MNVKQIYGIEFYKKSDPFNKPYYWAESIIQDNRDISSHISVSTKYLAQSQITALTKVLNGIPVQQDWGEIMGSSLDIYPGDLTVQVNYTNRRIPIQHFKQLLEDWLDFINE